MAVRLTTILQEFDSASWAPTGETILQYEAAFPATVRVFGRVNASAKWRELGTLSDIEPFLRLPKFPFLMVTCRNNKAGSAVNIWDDAA
jgi:hypothetical protein